MTYEDKKAVSTGAARDLIKIEVSTLRKIKKLSSYKELVINSVAEIFSFYGLDNSEDIILELYKYEEALAEQENSFQEKMNIGRNNDYIENSVGFASRALIELNEYVGSRIYYICQSYASEKYKGYELEDVFSPIIEKFRKEIQLPEEKIHNLHAKHSTAEIEYNRELDVLYLLPSTPWFYNKSKDKYAVQNFIEESKIEKTEENVQDHQNKHRIARMLKRFDDPEHKEASKLKRLGQQITSILSEDSIFNNDNNQFNSLNIIGTSRLFEDTYYYGRERTKYKTQDGDVSTKITNDDILEMLVYFEELGLSGEIIEVGDKFKIIDPHTYRDADGNIRKEKTLYGKPVLSNIKIEVSKYAKWTKTDNDLFHEYIKIKKFQNLLSYVDNKPVLTI